MPTVRSAPAASAVDVNIYAFGGNTPGPVALDTVEENNPLGYPLLRP